MLAYLVYIAVRSLNDYEYWTIFAGLTLGVHEGGHILFSPLGELLEVAGGSITQVAVPLVVAYAFLRQREYFGIAVALAWLSMSLTNLATYVGDARNQDLPLVSMGSGGPIHDWHYLLARYAMLGDARALARFTTFLSLLSIAAAIVLGAWLCNAMRLSAGEAAPADEGITSN
ncbi:MAG: hypothetical protein H0U66_04100 [Gemmatimonadaceae bacterium]|nr:hypothetical protein [Gemmatimonadaceae bacterium]